MLLTKKEYRVQLRRDRDKIPLPQKAVWDRKITETLLEDADYQRAESRFLYASFGSEVDTWSILEQALVAGKQVALPRVEGKEIRFYSIKGRQDLQTGTWGIMEPRAHCRPAEQADLMIMPGLGFDEARHRLGYGGGYYDRYLAAYEAREGKLPATCAAAYALQICPCLPAEATDMRPDRIVTEAGII